MSRGIKLTETIFQTNLNFSKDNPQGISGYQHRFEQKTNQNQQKKYKQAQAERFKYFHRTPFKSKESWGKFKIPNLPQDTCH
jgi:hypothetical protein